jgi:hypothetical protein
MPVVHQYLQPLQAIFGSGGIVSTDSRVSAAFAMRMLDELRASAIVEFFRQKLHIPEQLYQTTSLIYDEDYQTSDDTGKCIYLYPVPAIIPVSATHDGITYVGVRNGENLNRIKSQSVLSNYKKNYITRKIVEDQPWVMYQPDFSDVLFHKPFGGPAKTLVVRAIFVRPTQLPEYNIQKDEYPITDEIYNLVLRMAQELYSRGVLSSQPEAIANAAEDASLPPINQQNNNS